MADQTGKIQVQGEGDIDVTKGSAAANDNIEIIDASGAGKKTGTNEIELNAKLDLPDIDQNNQLLAATAAAALAANDNIEKEDGREMSETQNQPEEPATPLAPELPIEASTPKPATKPISTTATQSRQQHPAPDISPSAPVAAPSQTNELPAENPPSTEAEDTPQTALPQATTVQPESPPLKTPPSIPRPNNQPTPAENPPGQKALPPQTPPIQNAPTTPTVPNEALGQVGPHNLENKTPTTLPSSAQSQVGNELSANQAQNRNFGQRLGDNIGNKIQRGAQNVKNAPRNIINNIKSNFESDRSRTRQIRQERRQLESELSKLEGRLDSVKASGPMRIIKFWFPGIYASISGFGAGIANAKGEAKVAMLQAKLLTAETIKGTLKTAEGVSAFIEANIKVLSWIVESLETIVIPILLIVIYPIAILLVWIYIEFMGAIGAPLTKSIKELVKQVDIIIENLQKILTPEKKKIKIRRNIQLLNQMLASKEARKNMTPSPQATAENSNPNLGGEAANDNTEQTNYQQAA